MKALKWIREKAYEQQVNWSLLTFLLLFLDVKLWVKVLTLIFICLLKRKSFSRSALLKNRLLVFYLSMIVIAVVNLFLQAGYVSLPYLVGATVGIMFWLMAALASYLCFLYVEQNDPAKIHATIYLFFMANVLVTFATLGRIIMETGALNPYTYQGMYQKYFIMTGDYIRGISFDTSTTNSLLHAFGVVYFLNRRAGFPALLCMAGLLLTASNITNLLVMFTLAYMFAFQSNRDQKSLILVCLFFVVIFSVKVSPQNNDYVRNTIEKILQKNTGKTATAVPPAVDITKMPDSLLEPDDRRKKFAMLYLDSIERHRQKGELPATITSSSHAGNDLSTLPKIPLAEKPALPRDDIHSKPFQRNKAVTPLQKELIEFARKEGRESEKVGLYSQETKLPGKLIAARQTLAFYKNHPMTIITGTGIGNFSSKLAFRTTGLHIAGGYPSRFVYIHHDFRDNHLAVFLNYFSKDAGLHSVIHTPNSVYNQLLGEYGIAGLLAFLLFYAGFFIKKWRKLTYGLPLVLLMVSAFFIEYWFEQLSIVVLFELMLFLNIHENNEKTGMS